MVRSALTLASTLGVVVAAALSPAARGDAGSVRSACRPAQHQRLDVRDRQIAVLSRRVRIEHTFPGRRYELCDRASGRRELLDVSEDDFGEGAGEFSYELSGFRVQRRAVAWVAVRFDGGYHTSVVVHRQHRWTTRSYLAGVGAAVDGELALDGAGRTALVTRASWPLATQTLITTTTLGEQRRLDSGRQLDNVRVEAERVFWDHDGEARSRSLRQLDDRCPSPFEPGLNRPVATVEAVAADPARSYLPSQACLRADGVVRTIPGWVVMLAGPYAAAFPTVPPPAFAEPDLKGPLTVYDLRTGRPAGPAGPLAPEGRYGRLVAFDDSGALVFLRDEELVVRALDGTERTLDEAASTIVLDDGLLSWTGGDGQPHAASVRG